MKRLIPLIIGLALGIGGGTGLYIVRGGGAPEGTLVEGEDTETHGAVDAAGDTTHVAAVGPTDSTPDEHSDPVVDVEDLENEQENAIAEALLADPDHEAADEPPDVGSDLEVVHTEEVTSQEGADELAAGEEPAASGSTPASGATAQDAEEGAPTPGADGAGPSSSADLIGGPVDNEEAAKRVAKIFSQMQARDAARVLSLMERSEVELILKQLDNRSAAKILSGLSPEQAAALSAVLIRGGQ